jgi:GT2 family glycosyltransferase
MTTPPLASVVIAAYNHTDFVRRTLHALLRQSDTRFELLIADDGSGAELADLLQIMRQQGLAIRHFWQPDDGFRKCRLLNHTLLAAASDYLIFLDADCMPHRHFVRNHLNLRRTGEFLVGRRVQLGSRLTMALGDVAQALPAFESWPRLLWRSHFPQRCPETRHLESGLYLPPWMQRHAGGSLGLKGCNFSCWRDDLLAVNGFNERFETTGGGEDTDLDRRLLLRALRPRSVKHACICYHQHHALLERSPAGIALCQTLAQENAPRCSHGLSEHDGHDIVEC